MWNLFDMGSLSKSTGGITSFYVCVCVYSFLKLESKLVLHKMSKHKSIHLGSHRTQNKRKLEKRKPFI